MNQLIMELKTILTKYEPSLSSADIRDGLYGIVNIMISEPQYSSQTKEKLTSPQGRMIVKELFSQKFDYFLRRKDDVQKVAAHLKSLSRKKQDYLQSKILEAVDSNVSNILPGKLLDCVSRKLTENELLVTEGDSAGATAKMARDKMFQAVLPVKGKIINVERATMKKVVNFEGVKHIVASIGTGLGKAFDYSKLRYGKIILMSDADADGIQIKALITGLFFKYMKDVIINGHLYIANPPLFKLKIAKQEKFFLDRRTLENFL